MTHDDLSPQWDDLPLLDEDYTAGVLDLLVGMRDRLIGGLFLLVCDAQRRPLQPIMVSDDPEESSIRPQEAQHLLSNLATAVVTQIPGATAVVAIARPGSLRPSVNDLAMAQAITQAFAGHVELLGVHLITPRGCVAIDVGERTVA